MMTKKKNNAPFVRGALAVTALLSTAFLALIASPVMAFAEEAAEEAQETPSAFDILIPKPEEFFPALIAFLVIWVVLAKFVWPSVLKTLDARQKTIQDNLDAAEKNKIETARAYAKAQTSIEDAQAKAEDIISEAEHDAEATRETIIKKANADAERINQKAIENIEAKKNAVMVGLQDQMADLAVDLASEIIGEHLDADVQKRLIEDSLKEATGNVGPSSVNDASTGGADGTH